MFWFTSQDVTRRSRCSKDNEAAKLFADHFSTVFTSDEDFDPDALNFLHHQPRMGMDIRLGATKFTVSSI